jgi:hypothetical protein
MRLPDKYPELEPLTKGSSYQQLFDLLYKAGQLRYFQKSHLNKLNPKLGTPKKLQALVELNFLTCNNSQVYNITQKTKDLLHQEGYNCKILAETVSGEGNPHNLFLSSVILEEMKDDFYCAAYPSFTDLIPDALIVYKKPDAYRLLFLEVENEKADWENYIKGKKEKYKRLSQDYEIWDKWFRRWSRILELPFCKIEDFKFSYKVVRNE